MILSAQIKALLALVFVVVLISVYVKGRFDGSASAKVSNYKAEIKGYEDARDRSLEAYEQASKLQKIDIEAALKASEQRQEARLEAFTRSNLLDKSLEQNTSLENCVLDKQSLQLINQSLRGGKK